MDALGQPVLAATLEDALSPGSGRVVIIADASFLVDDALFEFFSPHETLFLNTLDYLGVPEPSGGVLAGIAGGVVGIGGAARSLRRKVRLRAFNR
jgi:hypothetical protein